MIKNEIGGIAMFQAEQQVAGFHDSDHYSSDDGEGHSRIRTWDDRMSQEMNDAFWRSDGMEGMFEMHLEAIKDLLNAFGLVLPFDELYSKDDLASCDLNCLSAISLPLHSTASSSTSPSFPSTTLKSDLNSMPVHGMTMFSNQIFALPSDAGSRFRSFLSLFHLQAIDAKSETVYQSQQVKHRSHNSQATESTSDKKQSESSKNPTHKAVCCKEPDIQPHWHMWTISHCN